MTLLASLIAVAGTLGGVAITSLLTDKREKFRQNHERQMKKDEIEASREEQLREERISAYRNLLTSSTESAEDMNNIWAVYDASVGVELMTKSPEVVKAAKQLYSAYEKLAKEIGKSGSKNSEAIEEASSKTSERREVFLQQARKELGV